MPQGAFGVGGVVGYRGDAQAGDGRQPRRRGFALIAPDAQGQHTDRNNPFGGVAGRPAERRVGGGEHHGTEGTKARLRLSVMAGSGRSRAASRAVRTT